MSKRSHEFSLVYLHAAHVFKEDKHNPDAFLICLCPRCHYFFDHPRNNDKQDEGVADWAFIGLVVKRVIEQQSQITQQQEVYT